ncbi:hypothetical protein D9M68_940660 [compost metagenome]
MLGLKVFDERVHPIHQHVVLDQFIRLELIVSMRLALGRCEVGEQAKAFSGVEQVPIQLLGGNINGRKRLQTIGGRPEDCHARIGCIEASALG